MVNLVYRKGEGAFSIENVFDAVYEQLSHSLPMKKTFLRHQRVNPYTLLANIRQARESQSEVNHVTGDVHYALLGLSDRFCNILTIHDAVLLEQKRGWQRRIAEEIWFRRPLQKAQHVTCISRKTAVEVLQLCPAIEEKLSIIPNPVQAAFKESAAREFGTRPRILHVGTKPNKNLGRVIEAVKGLDVELVVIGRLSSADRSLLAERHIRYTNRHSLPLDELVAEYVRSDIVMFVSLYEGFGLPIAEANTIGRPVITSRIAPMTEVAGDAALFVNPESVREIRAATAALIRNRELRANLVARGKHNARRYAADRVAAMYGALYEAGLRVK